MEGPMAKRSGMPRGSEDEAVRDAARGRWRSGERYREGAMVKGPMVKGAMVKGAMAKRSGMPRGGDGEAIKEAARERG